MTPESAYDYAKRVRAIGLAFFPREPESLANVGTEFAALTEEQADKVIRVMSARSKWDPAEFTRLVASVQAVKVSTWGNEHRDDYYGRITRWAQKFSVGTLQQMSNDAGRAAATMPTEDPRYQQAQADFVRIVTDLYGAVHLSISPSYLEHNTRSRLAYLLLEAACQETAEAK